MTAIIMRPIISLHGTAAASLVEARVQARGSARLLLAALGETAPNRRDYVGDDDAFKHDYAVYRARILIVDELYNSLMDEAVDIQQRAA